MSEEMPRQSRPQGVRWIASVEWKLWVNKRLGEKRWSRARLGKSVGVTGSAITQILGPRHLPPVESTTVLLPRINRALGGIAPKTVTVEEITNGHNEHEQELFDLVTTMSDEERSSLKAYADMIVRARPRR